MSKKENEPTFNKSALVNCEKYTNYRDLLNALLNENEKYTHSSVEKMLNGYLKREVI